MAEIDIPEERDLLAAEYALDVLDGDEQAAARARHAGSAAFMSDVGRWRSRFAAFLDGVAEEEVPAALWARVAERTGPLDAPGATRRLAAWRAGAIAAAALAATLAAVLLLQPARLAPSAPSPVVTRVVTRVIAASPAPVTFAQLVGPKGKASVAARYDPAAARLHVRARGLPEGERSPELWVIPEGGAPRSLGLIDQEGSRTLAVDVAARPLLRPGATLAITLEDAATAPHAAPSGDIIVSGIIARL